MKFSRIVGMGSCLPGAPVSNTELIAARGIDSSDAWIVERSGIRNRHFAGETQTTADLAFEASRAAMADAGIDPGAIDLIVLATSTPDMIFPSTACLLQSRLGIHGAAAFDVHAVALARQHLDPHRGHADAIIEGAFLFGDTEVHDDSSASRL